MLARLLKDAISEQPGRHAEACRHAMPCVRTALHCYWQVRSLNQWLNHALENDSDIAKTIKALTTECASALIPPSADPT
jgi:hypothetical protein